MMDNDKWVWGDQEESSPIIVPLLDAKLTPIVESPDPKAEPHSPPASPEKPGATLDSPQPNRKIPPSVVRAIVLHLEGRIEEAIQEIQIGLRDGEPPADLYSAMGALQSELER
jgi:hypothetical protein